MRAELAPALIAALAFAMLCAETAIAQTKPLILNAVQVAREGETVVVVLEADGPLPIPASGQLDSPPRFFLDFPGVITGIRGPRPGSAPVSRVRVALNSSNPPVTRVVLDLAGPQPVQIDTTARETGRIRIVVGAVEASAGASQPETGAAVSPVGEAPARPATSIPPVPSLPMAKPAATPPVADEPLPPVGGMPASGAAAAAERPAEPPASLPPPDVYPVKTGTAPSKPSADDVNRYRGQVLAPLTRLQALRPLLTGIDRQDPKLPDGLADARSEISGIMRVLAGVRPPASLQGTHDMLLRGASLSMMAATLRADAGARADPGAVRNASSAAAGALLLLDRVCIEVGCGEPARK